MNKIFEILYTKRYISKYSQKETDRVLDECIGLKKGCSDLVDANLEMSQKNVDYSVNLARFQEVIRNQVAALSDLRSACHQKQEIINGQNEDLIEAGIKIKAQTGQLSYFHKDRENIRKVRAENLEFRSRKTYRVGYDHGKDDGLLEGLIE